MGMLDGLIEQLENSPAVAKAMAQFNQLREIFVATVNRFDSRFQSAQDLQVAISKSLLDLHAKMDEILFHLKHPSDIAPAGDDGLMKMLESSGKEMIVRDDFQPIPVVHETEVN